MKLRLFGSSIRLRLTQSETSRLGAGETITETLRAGLEPQRHLVYEIVPSADAGELTADFKEGRLQLTIPLAAARQWADDPAQVGCYHEIAQDAGQTLKISVEKDFQCLKPRTGDDDRDTFPHPAEQSGAHLC